jgi:hypothetical protein
LFVQFLQDVSGVGRKTLQPCLVPILGTWHPYKHACGVLWRNIYQFMGPLFHNVHPGNKFFYSMKKLTKLTYWLTVVRLSLPDWIDEMEELLANENWRCKNPTNMKLHTYLSNFHTAVTYFLPLVSCVVGIRCCAYWW